MTLPRSVYADRLRERSDVALTDHAAFERRSRWREFFRGRIGAGFDGRVTFEVGCFDAAFLCRIAAKHPRTAFVGLDWKAKAILDGAARVADAGLRNVALVRGRGQDVGRIFGDGELDEIWVFHPDPCDRPQELKNRLIAEPFLIDAHAALRGPGSSVAIKTDHPGYYQWVLGLLGLPEPAWFAAARTGTPVAGRRVRARDLVRPEEVPPASEAVLERFDVGANAADYWNNSAALAHTAGRAFAGEATLFESRFVAKRLPIYFVELAKRTPSGRG
jgi:tRNA G46 methylase TrmB